MNIKIYGSPTLKSFTNAISNGFSKIVNVVDDNFFDIALIQIHGSSISKSFDLNILRETYSIKNKILIIHRPDELLEYQKLKEFFEKNKDFQIMFLGDLVYRFPFWKERQKNCFIVPHPFLDLTLP